MIEPSPSTHDIQISDAGVRLEPRPATTAWMPSDVEEFREDMLSLAIGCNASQELIDSLRKASGEELRATSDIFIKLIQGELGS
jgi:hypothetical protein